MQAVIKELKITVGLKHKFWGTNSIYFVPKEMIKMALGWKVSWAGLSVMLWVGYNGKRWFFRF